MTKKPILSLMLAAALASGVSGAAFAQQGTPTDTEAEGNATTVQPGTAPSAAGNMSDGAMAAGSGDMVEVGGAPMYANMTIAENAPNAPNLSTLVAAVSAAGLVETLGGEGPFTVFAPDNSAFEALPAGTVDTLLEEANRDQLTSILTYHVVPSAVLSTDLADGETEVTTVQGGTLTVTSEGGTVTVTDAQGNAATVTQADVLQSNGVVHVIDTVLMPAS